VDPAKRQTDRLIDPIAGQPFEAVVAVDLQNAFEAGQMFGWPQGTGQQLRRRMELEERASHASPTTAPS
jgi:hypothetical protein